MQTNLAPEYQNTPDGLAAEAILRKCVHCGFCTATCPTYQLLGDELDGPRGRIYLMKQVLEGAPVTRKTQQHLDRCLTCRNCESTCPSGVQYGQLVEIGRAVVDGKNPKAARAEIMERLDVGRSKAMAYAQTDITDTLRQARMAEADYAQEQFGMAIGLLWTSALIPTTRPWHASRNGKVYTSAEVTAFYGQRGNRYNCRCGVIQLSGDEVEALGLQPLLVPGPLENLKLTWPVDFALAARLLDAGIRRETIDDIRCLVDPGQTALARSAWEPVASKALVDGRGVERVADRIMELIFSQEE